MSLFLSVLIPLIGIVGNVLIAGDGSQLGRALAVAQREVLEKSIGSEDVDGFQVERVVTFVGDFTSVTVTLSKDGKQILKLHRILNKQ